MISPEDFGIAATLAMSVSLVEMLSDFGTGRFLTRVRGDDGNEWMSAVHSIAIVRGCVGGVVLVAIASPFATLMKMPEAALAFAIIGMVPLLRGFTHNEIWLNQSELRFRAFVTCQAIPQFVTLLVAYPLVLWYADYWALLWLLLINAALSVVLSHVIATTRYRLALSRRRFGEILGYGIPLLCDGILMFVVLHGERIVIGSIYGKALLGAYSVSLMLAWTPPAALGRLVISLGVPHFAAIGSDRVMRDRQFALACRLVAAPATGFAIMLALGGSEIVTTLFGANYILSAPAVMFLGVGQAFRLLRVMGIVIALAEGLTTTAMLANTWRVAAVFVGLGMARAGAEAAVVLAVGALGEFVALATVCLLNRVRFGISWFSLAVAALAVVLGCGSAWGMRETLVPMSLSGAQLASVAVLLGATSIALMFLAEPAVRALLRGGGLFNVPQFRRGQ